MKKNAAVGWCEENLGDEGKIVIVPGEKRGQKGAKRVHQAAEKPFQGGGMC